MNIAPQITDNWIWIATIALIAAIWWFGRGASRKPATTASRRRHGCC